LETAAKLLKSLERVRVDFSKGGLKSLDNQGDFDSAIRRFESFRPSQDLSSKIKMLKMLWGTRTLSAAAALLSANGS
jgi:hypothetical protein